MTRIVVLLALTCATAALGTAACGGNEKPPLTPDTEVKSPDLGDAGAADPTAAPAPAK